MAVASDEFPTPTSKVSEWRQTLARALPGLIFAGYLVLFMKWDSTTERLFYSAAGGLLFQVAPLLLVGISYFFVCWVAGMEPGDLDSNPFHSRRLLAGMVAVAGLWAWHGYSQQVAMKELVNCVEYEMANAPPEEIRFVIEGCRSRDDDGDEEF
jgi:hypothetical protein